MDQVKRAFRSIFCRDLRNVEPSKKGLIVGEVLRVYDEPSGTLVAFLKGTDRNTRKQYTDKLDTEGVSYKLTKDFEL